ncbi:MAG: exonuclease SbcD, partial [Planctomycetota bacterium]
SEFEVGPASQLAGWFLGHIHAPSHDQLSSDRPCGYLGSLVGLDPGEPGAHGPWIVTVDEQNLQCQQHALGPLVFDRLDLSLSDHESLTDLDIEDKIQSLFRAAVKRNFSESWLKNKNIKAVAIRLTLVGKVTNAARYRKISTRLLEQGDLTHEEDSCLFFVEAMINKLAPHIDFEAIANGTGALSLLAQMVVNSEGNSSDPRVSALIQTMETVAAEPGWQSLSSERHPLPPISELVHENLLAVFSDLHQELMAESEQTL